MKKYGIVALIALLMTSLSVSAQETDKKDGGKRAPRETKVSAKERADNMSKQLELTAEQIVQVQALLEKQDAQREEQIAKQRAEREKTSQDRDKQREEMRKNFAENDAELEAIIGTEKMEQWKALREDQMKKGREGRQAPAHRRR